MDEFPVPNKDNLDTDQRSLHEKTGEPYVEGGCLKSRTREFPGSVCQECEDESAELC